MTNIRLLDEPRFRGLWFCRFAGSEGREKRWYVTYLDSDGDFSETDGSPSWQEALDEGLAAILQVEVRIWTHSPEWNNLYGWSMGDQDE